MILSICSNPDVLSVMKYVKLALNLIRIIIPIVLIITIMLTLINAVTGKSDDDLPNALKTSVNKILAAILIFLIPTFISIIFSVIGANSELYKGCLDNATDENIKIAYIKQAQTYTSRANESLLRSDYNFAQSKVNNLKDESSKNNLQKQLDEIKKKIEEREEEERQAAKKGGGIGLIGDGFMYPLNDYKGTLTACFAGNDSIHNGNHGATDIAADANTPIYAAKGGKIVEIVKNVLYNSYDLSVGGCGNYITIDHQDGTTSSYCHMYPGSVLVDYGDMVSQGQQIGAVGSTGHSTGYHLHYEITVNGQRVDPINYTEMNVTNPGACG